jgi:hypothetical protein
MQQERQRPLTVAWRCRLNRRCGKNNPSSALQVDLYETCSVLRELLNEEKVSCEDDLVGKEKLSFALRSTPYLV